MDKEYVFHEMPEPKYPNKPEGRMVYKVPMLKRVVTLQGQIWDYRFINGNIEWRPYGSACDILLARHINT